jgi:hypothetical protein
MCKKHFLFICRMRLTRENKMKTDDFIMVIEIGKPIQWKPGKYESEVLVRYWFLVFWVSFLKVSFREFSETSYRWESK